jgi:hypothetical protein
MLAKSIDAKVRPLANTSLEKSSLIGAARIYVSKDTMLSLNGNLESGKHCIVTRLENPREAKEDGPREELQREASLWILPEKNLSPNVVMMTRAFQDATGFKIGDPVRIALAGATPDAEEIVVQDATEKTEKTANDIESMKKHEKEARYPPSWEASLACALGTSTIKQTIKQILTCDIQLVLIKSIPAWSWKQFFLANIDELSRSYPSTLKPTVWPVSTMPHQPSAFPMETSQKLKPTAMQAVTLS